MASKCDGMELRHVLSIALVLTLPLVLLPVVGGAAEEACPDPAPVSGVPRWPAPPEDGAFDVAHFGEGHWNEGQGPTTMPVLVQDLLSYRPDFVAFSSDMADIGEEPQLTCFRDLMQPLLDADIPWFDSPGNHDREPIAGPGGVLNGTITTWREVFAGMLKPWGDGPHPGPGFVLPQGEPDDGPGAATHYSLDYGPPGGDPVLRLVVLDNSKHSLTGSDDDQYPAVGPGERDASQFTFLHRTATKAAEEGLLSFVMMHEPTQDPRDHTKAHPISYNHTMNKGATGDNVLFDAMAASTGVDGVLLGHIQGNTTYRVGDVEYFVDGGGGGTPYTLEETGTDTGYLYGFRILRLSEDGDGWSFRTYLVPLVDHIELVGPGELSPGEEGEWSATAVQPHDPDLEARFGLMPNEPIRVELRPPEPSPLEEENVPPVSYVWESSNPEVLAPVPGPEDPVDDPAFHEGRMTTSGRFRAVGIGTAQVTVATGTHSTSKEVTVPPGLVVVP